MLRFVVINDPHVADVGPSSRCDDYANTCIQKLTEVAEACKVVKASALIITGDLYNFKNPRRSSHEMNNRLMEVFRSASCDVLTILGNHDLDGSIATLDKQPIGVLIKSGVVKLLTQTVYTSPGNPSVHIVGHNHSYTNPMLFMEEIEAAQRDPAHIFVDVCHTGLLTEETNIPEMFNVHSIWHRGIWNVLLSGHIHNDLGIVQDAQSNKLFCNVGALLRGTIAESNLVRTPKYLVLEVEGAKISAHPIALQCTQESSKVFKIQEHRAKKNQKQQFEAFVNFVTQQMQVTKDRTVEEIIEDFFIRMNIAPDLRKEVSGYLGRASE